MFEEIQLHRRRFAKLMFAIGVSTWVLLACATPAEPETPEANSTGLAGDEVNASQEDDDAAANNANASVNQASDADDFLDEPGDVAANEDSAQDVASDSFGNIAQNAVIPEESADPDLDVVGQDQPTAETQPGAGNVATTPHQMPVAPANNAQAPVAAVTAADLAAEKTVTTLDPADTMDYDILPNRSLLWWVGYDFDLGKGTVRVELVTRGGPQYVLRQEKNKAGQPELTVRFLETGLRAKLKRLIDASEFLSPVAMIRTRPNLIDESVDVVLTLRDPVMPRVFANNGNVLLTFALPEKYRGNANAKNIQGAQAELLTALDIRPTLLGGSQRPKNSESAGGIDPSVGVFVGAPANGGDAPNTAEATSSDDKSTHLPVGQVDQDIEAASAINDASLENGAAAENVRQNSNGQQESQENHDQSEPLNQGSDNQDGNQADDTDESNQQQGNPNESLDQAALRGGTKAPNEVGVYSVFSFSLVSVGQDNGQENFESDFDSTDADEIESVTEATNIETPENPSNSTQQSAAEQGNEAAEVDGANVNTELEDAGLTSKNNGEMFTPEPTAAAPAPEAQPAVQAAPVPPTVTPLSPEPASETVGQDTPTAPTPASGYRPVTLEFRGAKLKEVIRTLGEENHINFTFPATIGEPLVFMNFKDVPWDDALRAVLETNGLGMVKLEGGVVRIDTIAKLTAEKDELFRIRESTAKLTPTKVLVLRLSYAQAADVKKLIDEMLTSSKFDRRVRVDIDARTNSLVIEATPVDLAKAKALVERIDLQTPQVQIASRIVEVLRSSLNLLGIDWAGPLMGDHGRGLGFGNLVFPNHVMSSFAIDTGAVSNAQTKTGISAHVGSVNSSLELDLRLKFEESRGTTHILQNNNLVVEDNGQAKIQAGRQDFFIVQSASGTNITNVDYMLQLEVTPHITADGAVQMKLKIESSSPAAKVSADADSSRSQRLLETSLLKNSGETAAIGGLYTTEKKDEVFGIPILSDIPIIGALFRTKKAGDDRRELIILVTPTIINSTKAGTASVDGFSSQGGEEQAAGNESSGETVATGNVAANGENSSNSAANGTVNEQGNVQEQSDSAQNNAAPNDAENNENNSESNQISNQESSDE